MKITIFGTGYVGLVQGAVLANSGHEVLCVDINQAKVDSLNAGYVPIFEPGLEVLVKKNLVEQRLQFTSDAAKGVAHGCLQFIAVGTPPDEDGSADLQYVLTVAQSIAELMNDYRVIVNKSTVPVGTADQVAEQVATILASRGIDIPFDVVSNPEFLKEGAAVQDCQRPDRIIIGTNSVKAEVLLRELYTPFNRNHDKIIMMDVRSAELTKYAANCMLATKISFMNEMSNLAELLGADIEAVRQGIGSDPRIGYHFIYPGCGYGGSCFPKDIQALIHTSEAVGFDAKVLKAVEARNVLQKESLLQKLQNHFKGDLQGKIIAVWGLSFKPNTDDVREAPSRVLIEALWSLGAKVQAFDPEAATEMRRIYGKREDFILSNNKDDVLEHADALVICTEWQQFRAPNFERMKKQMKQYVIVDGRNLYDPSSVRKAGFTYYSVGRA